MLAQSLALFFLLNPTSNPLGHPIGFTFNIFRIQVLFTSISYQEDYRNSLTTLSASFTSINVLSMRIAALLLNAVVFKVLSPNQ